MLNTRQTCASMIAVAAALLLSAPLHAQEYRYQSAQAAPAPAAAVPDKHAATNALRRDHWARCSK